MILIFSTENEFSTCDIMDWLKFYHKEVVRINLDDDDLSIKFEISLTNENTTFDEHYFLYNGKKICLNQIEGFWYRRGHNVQLFEPNDIYNLLSNSLYNNIVADLNYESKVISTYVNELLSENVKKSIGSKTYSLPNKLKTLHIAKKSGLAIPKTIITDSKIQLQKFMEVDCNGEGVITKAIGEGLHFPCEGMFYSAYTEDISNDLEEIPNSFFPSIFQEKIKKEYELRIFYFHERFYAMAIFSQNNEKTAVDFRKYDEKIPNRFVPYKLPSVIESKINSFMKKMNLNTGSLDFIYSNGDYIFLEVNPVGQFAMVSNPCNYYIEKEIANYFILN